MSRRSALYPRVATNTIREVMSPLKHIARKLKEAKPPPEAARVAFAVLER
jgi:hypothetical protein